MFIANIWKSMSSQVPPQQSVPAARAPVLQPCPGQTLCPVSCLGKDESTGVHPVPLGCTLCLPLPMMAISFLTGRDSGAQGREWSLAALLRGKVVPDCVGATPAPLLPQCRAPETIHICHGNHGRGSASWALSSPSRHPPSHPHPDPPACSDSESGLCRRVAGGRTDRPWGCPALPPTHRTPGFCCCFPQAATGSSMAATGTHVQAIWPRKDRSRLRRLFGGSSEEVLSFCQTCLSCSLPPLTLLAWPDCSGQPSPVFVPGVIPGVFGSARPG